MKRWALPVAGIAVVIVSLAGAIVARREVHARRLEAGQLRTEVQQWRAKAEMASKELESLRAAQGLPPAEHAEQAAAPPASTDDVAVRRELVKLLAEKDEKLSAAAKDLEQLRGQAEEFEQKVRTLTEETQKLTGSERDARDRLDTARRLTEALQTEMKGKNARALQVEVANQQLRSKEEESRQRISRLVKLAEEADDLYRRREMYMANILRRYREVTDLYRMLNQQFANPRDGAAPANNDLSRVQNAIYQAEDDMRQLQSLNSQAARLQKEMAAARK